MTGTLAHTIVEPTGRPGHWLYILHGIFGSGRNWASLARRLVNARPEWGVVLVDLRLHGGSVGFEPPHTVKAAAEDVVRLAGELDRPPSALLGHSFGGKVGLMAAGSLGGKLRQVWVVDSPLGPREAGGGAWEVLQLIRRLPERFASRDELVQLLAENGQTRGMGHWMAMNLERADGEFRWRIDWDGVEEMLRDYHSLDVWKLIEHPAEGVELHFVKAKQSNAIGPDALARLDSAGLSSGRVFVHQVDGSHWINVDNPEGVERLLEEKLG